MPISFHEEDPKYIENNGVNRGKASEYYGIGGSSREAEIALVERDLKLAEETGACIDIQHISSKEAVELVRQAKKRCSNIHAEATPHHFTLTEDAVIKYGTLAKMNPPLREEEDRQAVIRGLVDGTIDMIATDHAPHEYESGCHVSSRCRISGGGRPCGCDPDRYCGRVHPGAVCIQGNEHSFYRMEIKR